MDLTVTEDCEKQGVRSKTTFVNYVFLSLWLDSTFHFKAEL